MKKRLFAGTISFCIGSTLFPHMPLAADEGEQSEIVQYYSDITDIIGPITPLDTGKEIEGGQITIPNTDEFQTNLDFKRYDPAYPEKNQYGDYILQVPDLKGRLTFSIGKKNEVIGTLYAPGTSKNGGWKDATKKWGNYDSGLCFAASSSNLISWYLDRYLKLNPQDNNEYETDVEKVFDRFRNGWDSAVGGDQKEALSWYFTGGFPSGNPNPSGSHLTGKEPGGYLRHKIPNNTSENWADVSLWWKPEEKFTVFGGYDDNKFPFIEEVGGMTGKGAFSTLESFSEQILRQLHYGACTISVVTDSSMGGSGHAITLWGADYDVNTGLVTAIHVTDSDDAKRGKFTIGIQRGDSNGGVRMVDYSYHPPIGSSQRFTRIRDSIVMYAPEVVMLSNEKIEKLEVEGTKKVDISKMDAQTFKLKGTDVYGNELNYEPKYSVQFKDDRGNIITKDKVKTEYDILNGKLLVYVMDKNIPEGTYTAEITEIVTNQKFEVEFEFYKDEQKTTYTVTFHPNKGDGVMNVQQFEGDVEQALVDNKFTRAGYTFKGWSKQPDGNVEYANGDRVINLSTQNGGNVDLYAVWEANSYTVTFDSNGGEGTMNPQAMKYDTLEKLTANKYTKEGYVFKGWSTTKDGEVEYTDGKEVINLVPEGNITLYAVWEASSYQANSYTVTFDSNGGEGTMKPQAMKYDDLEKLTANKYTKEGYVFKGWSTTKDGQVEYTDGKEVINLVPEGNITLYAVWEANSYTVTFDSNGGEGTMNPQAMKYDTLEKLIANKYTKEGYVFKGWSTTKDGEVEYTDGKEVINLVPEGNITLYAVWEASSYQANSYTVTFDSNGGEGTMKPQAMKYDAPEKLIANKYTKEGYVFKGWSTTKDGQVEYTDGKEVINLVPEGNITLYAVWEKNEVQPSAPDKSDSITSNTPQTGDALSTYLFGSMFASLSGLLAMCLNRKRKNK